MKKTLLAFLLFPAITLADSGVVNFLSAELGSASGGSGDSVAGFGYEAVISEKLSLSLDYSDLRYEDGTVFDSTEANMNVAIGSFGEGSTYVGIGALIPFNNDTGPEFIASANSIHDELSTGVNAGYSKRTGKGIDYDIGVTFLDKRAPRYSASILAPVGPTGFGISLGLEKSEGGLVYTSLGVYVAF